MAGSSHSHNLPEHQVKAAFLFNFPAFISWPESRFNTPDSPLRYCILGAKKISYTLEQLIVSDKTASRPMIVRQLKSGDDILDCHILFMHDHNRYRTMLNAARQHDILTVGDSKAFLEDGGIMSLLVVRRRVKPAINLDALKLSTLRISSKLLRLATNKRSKARD